MSRQPLPGAGASVRTPSGVAARAPRARYNALLVTLYERTSLTLREIAVAAGHTERAVQMLVRALGCRPRNAKSCRPGTNVGVRRAGPRPPPLNAPATRRAVAAFANAARELAASVQMREASELQRVTARAERRTARTRTLVLTGAARELRHLAVTFEDLTMAKRALAEGRERPRARKAARKTKQEPARPSPEDMRRAQERVLREQETRMHEAHQAKAARAATPPAAETNTERRINAAAARHDAGQGPRIRGL